MKNRYFQMQNQNRQEQVAVAEKVMPMPEPQKMVSGYECLYGKHPAELLHRGTAYCRTCYDDKNLHGNLIDQ